MLFQCKLLSAVYVECIYLGVYINFEPRKEPDSMAASGEYVLPGVFVEFCVLAEGLGHSTSLLVALMK